jgi:hypothetical protein
MKTLNIYTDVIIEIHVYAICYIQEVDHHNAVSILGLCTRFGCSEAAEDYHDACTSVTHVT